jgi:hypothetical protein
MDDLFRHRHGRASRARRAIQKRLRFRPPGVRVLANSVPKAGTHLLARCLEQFPGMIDSGVHLEPITEAGELEATLGSLPPGSFATAHLPFRPGRAGVLEASDVVHTLIVRDPRDVVVSHFHYVTRRSTQHRLHDYFNRLPDDAARLMASIRGVDAAAAGLERGLENIDQRFRRYLQWQSEDCCLIRFRELVGPRGGGSRARQIEEVRRLAAHLGLALDDRDLARIVERTFFAGSTTFRRGKIGDWRNHFTEEHKAAFKEIAGQILIDLDLERDLDW